MFFNSVSASREQVIDAILALSYQLWTIVFPRAFPELFMQREAPIKWKKHSLAYFLLDNEQQAVFTVICTTEVFFPLVPHTCRLVNQVVEAKRVTRLFTLSSRCLLWSTTKEHSVGGRELASRVVLASSKLARPLNFDKVDISLTELRSASKYQTLLYNTFLKGKHEVKEAQLVQDKFLFTKEDVQRNNNWLLRHACSDGHLKFAQWLTTTFQLSQRDLKDTTFNCLHQACANGHLHVVRWLSEQFKFTSQEVSKIWQTQCLNNLEVAKWLHQRYRITYHDELSQLHLAGKHSSVGKWIVEIIECRQSVWAMKDKP